MLRSNLKCEIKITDSCLKKLSKLYRNNRRLELQVISTIDLISRNPFDLKLKTHKVTVKKYKLVNSTSVTGDIRILWKFEEDNKTYILLLDIGGHSGKNSVYI